jgi:2-amino-4-hydroxy-6-hydroxymethyldihydropteridine diphosphokinase
MSTEQTVYICAGSNVGDRLYYIREATHRLREFMDLKLLRVSSLYSSEPWGNEDQPDYLNCVLEIATAREPYDLLDRVKYLEKFAGRRSRNGQWPPREIDLDILLYGSLILKSTRLIIPHKYLILRKFMLLPLNELGPQLELPGLGLNVQQALNQCPDQGKVDIYMKSWL